MTNITIITGTRGAGKTTLMKEAARLMPDAIGVISEKIIDECGAVVGYDAVLVPNADRLPLCRRVSDARFTTRQGGFWFDMSVFNRVNDYILSNFDENSPVIIDEIGKLEMERHSGYYSTLAALMQKPTLTLLISVRG